jgi:hypothetical protein
MNNEFYKTSLEVLTANGVPQDIAQQASAVVAKDDSTQPNLGRTFEEMAVVKEALNHMTAYWKKQEGNE